MINNLLESKSFRREVFSPDELIDATVEILDTFSTILTKYNFLHEFHDYPIQAGKVIVILDISNVDIINDVFLDEGYDLAQSTYVPSCYIFLHHEIIYESDLIYPSMWGGGNPAETDRGFVEIGFGQRRI